jgi:hypothetical protein
VKLRTAVAHGYEPSTGGLTTTFIKSIYDNFKDLKKAGPAKDWIKHTATNIGFVLGVGNAQSRAHRPIPYQCRYRA